MAVEIVSVLDNLHLLLPIAKCWLAVAAVVVVVDPKIDLGGFAGGAGRGRCLCHICQRQ